MRKNAKCLSIIILIFVLILINPLFSQTTNSVEKDIQSKGNYSFPANSSEIINKYSSQDKKLLPFVYNGFIYTFSVDRKLLLWKFFIGGDLENPFVLDNNQLFFFDIYNRLYSVDFIDGKLRWVKAIDNEIIGKPVIIKGSVVVITQNGRILVFSKSSGKLIELYDTKHEIAGGGNFYKDLMVVTFKEGMIIAYNIYTGKKVWQFINTGFISIKPIIDEGKLFFGIKNPYFIDRFLEISIPPRSPAATACVSKFVAVVELFNHPRELSAIITNHSYTERALDYCSDKNIATFTLQDLESLYLYIQKSLYGLPRYYLEVLKSFAKQLFKF